jgi:RsiW-degrading membrane proteinase PrsW (M82 family)
MDNINLIATLCFIGGFLPALVWLWFWLKEDKLKPEPNWMILKTFIAGGFAVLGAFLLQHLSINILSRFGFSLNLEAEELISTSFFLSSLGFLLVWAGIEEIVKFLATFFVAFRNRNYDEPIDAMMYIIITAIGFAAVENTLFLLDTSISGGNTMSLLLTGNMRFLGATVVHILSSAIVGIMISFAFYSNSFKKISFLAIGLILATFLHATFNFLIIRSSGLDMLYIFSGLWAIAIFIIFIFERVKYFNRPLNSPVITSEIKL